MKKKVIPFLSFYFYDYITLNFKKNPKFSEFYCSFFFNLERAL